MRSLVGEPPDVRLPAVETAPRLDASRPTPLRAGGFALTVLGAVLLGIGAVGTWITVGIPNESAHSSFRGTELADGRVVLTCAFVVLVAILASRPVRSRRTRYALAAVTVIAGLVGALVSAAFLRDGKDRGAVLAGIGIARDLWIRFGVFRDLGAGPYLALAGGLLCVAGGILTFWWARRLPQPARVPDEVSPEAASG